MEAAITMFNQILKMFLMMSVGYYLYKKKTIDDTTTSKLSNILLMVSTPATIITSFNQTYSYEKLKGLVLAFILSLSIYLMNLIIGEILFKNKPEEKFAIGYSNAAFIGIPLITGLLGIEAVFYLSPFIALFYIFGWTYGVWIMSNDKKNITAKKVLTNPCVLAVFLGVILFLLPTKPYAPIMESISTMANLTTPLAMIILGAYLAKCNLIHIFTNKRVYFVSALRLVILPLIALIFLTIVPVQDVTIKMVMLIVAGAPTAALLPIFCQMFDHDIVYGTEVVCFTTLASIITLPLLILLSTFIW